MSGESASRGVAPGRPLSILVASHGPVAGALVESVRRIAGRSVDHIEAICFDWEQDGAEVEAELRRALRGQEVTLILVDLPGSTPARAARRLVESGRVAALSGVNLPMLVRLACCPPAAGTSLEDLAREVAARGRDSFRVALAGEVEPGEGCG